MSFTFNGITPNTIIFNGVELTEVICNGKVVWESFDTSILQDFEYTKNSNGTFTLTNWKKTYNGIQSTECIIPDNNKIII